MKTKTHTAEEFASIERIARIVSSVRGARPDYAQLAAELEQAVPFDVFGVVLLRHDRQAVRVTACQREANGWVTKYHQLPARESKLATLLEKPVLEVRDYPAGLDGAPAESGDALSGYHQLHATLIAPLMVEERVLGSLELGSTGIATYAPPDLQGLVSAVARVLATAIESVQLGGNAAIQDRQRRALKDVTSALNARADLSSVLQQIVDGVAHTLNLGSGIVLQERRTNRLRLEALAGISQEMHTLLMQQEFPLQEDRIFGRTLLQRQSFVSQDISKDERFPANATLSEALGMRSLLTYPLVTEKTAYGVIFLCSPEPGGFTPLKADILSLFADQATIAIHNGMVLEAVQQRRRFQEAIEQLEQAQQEHAPGQHPSTQEDLELFLHVQRETQRTLGISFATLVRLVSERLLTRSERDLHAAFASGPDDLALDLEGLLFPDLLTGVGAKGQVARDPREAYAETTELLARTTESAMTTYGTLGGLGRLLMHIKTTVSGVRDAWFMVNLDGVCSYMNPAAEVLCELRTEPLSSVYSAQLLVSTPLREGLMIEDAFARVLPRIRNAKEVRAYLQDFTQGSTYRQELHCVLAAESLIPSGQQLFAGARQLRQESVPSDYHYHLTRYPLYNEQGQLEMYGLQVQDITEQVRDEKNRSALLSSVSHDLRTPLTTIKAAVTGLLQADVAWEERDRQAMLEDINSETDHLTVLVTALVELSRIQMGALILEKEWCDVGEVVYGALAKLKHQLAGLRVRIDTPRHLPLIYVDHAQLERVFYNLIENAALHSPEGGEIEVCIDAINLGPDVVRVRVKDQGESIPASERDHIFSSFYSLRSYSNGMGLAICKGIIELHQGQIWLDATVEEGTCFVFTLPTHPHTVVHPGGDSIAPARGE